MTQVADPIPRIMEGDEPPKEGPYITVTDPEELEVEDTTEAHLERIAAGVILGTENYQKNREIKSKLEGKLIKKVGSKGKMITDRLFDLINGVWVEDTRHVKGKKQKRRIYQSPPSLPAIKLALEAVIGKPVAKTEHTEIKSGFTTVELIIKGLADKGYGKRTDTIRGTAKESTKKS